MKAPPTDNKISARAIVTLTLTLEVSVNDKWGHECSVAQIHKQAKKGAIAFLQSSYDGKQSKIKIVSDLVVRTVIVDENP